ncbi:Oidioi.mRNA.OKI2018_I69.XSR.g14242.t1.cds [Oikopleura dioica]|uniref:Oidioi.mRNA.OKI2018_I69.XSR.g14242.t1.cds n=1 Tax=Oikopleura dioica TaxID=34765 RepID=A0ABN7S971_OIKDI|nr:Oidioi.mRNA.OKI2018_I69.XSR.g14242.t1.cds [Oikopleura dioica]
MGRKKTKKDAEIEAGPNGPKDPRVGEKYQIALPDYVDLSAIDDAVDESEVMWKPTDLVDDDEEDLAHFIEYARAKDYQEDDALTLLRHLNMDMRRAYLYIDKYRLKLFVILADSLFQ